MKTQRTLAALMSFVAVLALGLPVQGQSFMRIGDIDGFGYGDGQGPSPQGAVPYFAGGVSGLSPDVDGSGLLGEGDLLPDLNANSSVDTGSNDNFDNRSAAEVAGTANSSNNWTINTGSGSEWTDMALSTSYDNDNTIWNHDTSSFFGGGPFPDGNDNVPNEPVYIFDFFAPTGSVDSGQGVTLEVVYGDMDIGPFDISVDFAAAPTLTLPITDIVTQPVPAGYNNNDGLIGATTAVLPFGSVFTAAAGGFDGFVRVEFNLPNESYTSFDFAQLSQEQEVVVIPEPSAFVLAAFGVLSLASFGWRRRW